MKPGAPQQLVQLLASDRVQRHGDADGAGAVADERLRIANSLDHLRDLSGGERCLDDLGPGLLVGGQGGEASAATLNEGMEKCVPSSVSGRPPAALRHSRVGSVRVFECRLDALIDLIAEVPYAPRGAVTVTESLLALVQRIGSALAERPVIGQAAASALAAMCRRLRTLDASWV